MLRAHLLFCTTAALAGCAGRPVAPTPPAPVLPSQRPLCPTADPLAAAHDDDDAHLARWIATAQCFAGSARHPLHRLHLESIAKILRELYVPCVGDTFPDALQTPADVKSGTIRYLKESFAGFVESGWRFEDYLDRKRALIFAADGIGRRHFQMYLPRNWNPDRAFPLHLYIHGHEPKHNPGRFWALAMKGPATVVERQARSTGGSFPVVADLRGEGFSVRGYYHDQCQVHSYGLEVTQSIVRFMFEHFAVDRDRVYLQGASMGSQAVWNAAARMPDTFAAVVGEWTRVFEGARPPDAVVANLAHMPYRLLGGERDQMDKHMLPYRAALRAIGNQPDWFVEPGAGHGAATRARGIELFNENYDWIVKHVRRRPDRLSFTTDRADFRGAWGIELAFTALNPEALPGFDVAISGGEIAITTRNATGLSVDLGPNGLNAPAPCAVLLNGRQVHRGAPVRLVDLSVVTPR